MNGSIDNTGLLIILQSDTLESILKKAKELEKEYEWLQATEYYKKATDLALVEKHFLKAADLHDQMGFCFYKAAFQAQTNTEFKELLKKAIQTYEKESKLLEDGDENEHITTNHANALVAYTKSWFETNPRTRKKLLDKWWTLENEVLEAFEISGDLRAVGRTCTDLIEYSCYDRFWLVSEYLEQEKMFKESLVLAEKSIQIFSKLNDEYELARAYWIASWYCGFINWFEEDEDKITQITRKCQDYANKALQLSQEIGDAWLISRAYNAAWNAAQILNVDPTTAIKIGKNMLEYGNVAKDNYLIGWGNSLTSFSTTHLARLFEDPDKQKESYNKAYKMAQEATHNFQIINHVNGFFA
ncbi:MAG: hypothetical protein NWE80_03785, partial [Candidatus Bathyarchaeota archaeon]|nr:hypothetical protein [Candidatus Bathyarchaeota archaeon]